MKYINFMRHANSPNVIGDDFNRVLSELGHKEAKKSAEYLKNNINIDYILTSDAPRILETSKYIENLFPNVPTSRSRVIYNRDNGYIFDLIVEISNNYNNILLLGHNPSILELASNFLRPEYKEDDRISSMEPAKIISVQFEIQNWSDMSADSGKIVSVFVPL